MIDLCVKCGEKPVYIKSRQLCSMCYQQERLSLTLDFKVCIQCGKKLRSDNRKDLCKKCAYKQKHPRRVKNEGLCVVCNRYPIVATSLCNKCYQHQYRQPNTVRVDRVYCITCGAYLNSKSKGNQCSKCRRKVSPTSYCGTCGKPLNGRNKYGYCMNCRDAAAITKEWQANNVHKRKSSSALRELRMELAEGYVEEFAFLRKLRDESGLCVYCGKEIHMNYRIDHIVPIVKEGTNWIDNLQPLCKECNAHKLAKWPWEYEKSIGFARDEEFWNNFRLYNTPHCIKMTLEEIESFV